MAFESSEKIIERFIRRSRLTKHEKWKERAIIRAEKGLKNTKDSVTDNS